MKKNNFTIYMNFKKSKVKNKKYSVITPKGKKIDFGDKRFQQFKDTTGLGLYSDLDHNDKKRKKNYCKRSGNIKDKKGDLTKNDKESANYYARTYLWSC